MVRKREQGWWSGCWLCLPGKQCSWQYIYECRWSFLATSNLVEGSWGCEIYHHIHRSYWHGWLRLSLVGQIQECTTNFWNIVSHHHSASHVWMLWKGVISHHLVHGVPQNKWVGWGRVGNFVSKGNIDDFDKQCRRQQDNILVVIEGIYLVLVR